MEGPQPRGNGALALGRSSLALGLLGLLVAPSIASLLGQATPGPVVGLLMVAGGLAAGIAAGLFGVGGGLVMTPVLHYLVGMEWHSAVAASLLVIAVNTPLGLWDQGRRGNLLIGTGLLLAAGGLIGVVLAHRAAPHVPVAWLKLAFGLLLAWAAFRVARSGGRGSPAGRAPTGDPGGAVAGPLPGSGAPVALLLPAGIAAGFAARLLGIGGGLLMVPVMVLAGIPIHHAVATSLIAVETNALAATLVNLAALPGLALVALLFALGAMPGIRIGVWAANALTGRGLSVVYGLGLAAAAAYIGLDGLAVLRGD